MYIYEKKGRYVIDFQDVPSKRAEMKEIDNLRQMNAITPEEHQSLQALIGEDRNVALNGLPQVAAKQLEAPRERRAPSRHWRETGQHFILSVPCKEPPARGRERHGFAGSAAT